MGVTMTYPCEKNDFETSDNRTEMDRVMIEVKPGYYRFLGLLWGFIGIGKDGRGDKRLRKMETIYAIGYGVGLRYAIQVNLDGSKQRVKFENMGWRTI
jgi:hypothetical protein